MSAVSTSRRPVAGWVVLMLAVVVEICSLVLAAVSIGRAVASSLDRSVLAALCGYAFPVGMHLGAATAAWRARRRERGRAVNRRMLVTYTGILAVFGALGAAYSADGWSPLVLLVGAVGAVAGPITIYLVTERSHLHIPNLTGRGAISKTR